MLGQLVGIYFEGEGPCNFALSTERGGRPQSEVGLLGEQIRGIREVHMVTEGQWKRGEGHNIDRHEAC